jgi:hypothetical protein
MVFVNGDISAMQTYLTRSFGPISAVGEAFITYSRCLSSLSQRDRSEVLVAGG